MTPKPSNVRIAIPNDEEAIYQLLKNHLYSENALFPLSENKARETIRRACNHDNAMIGVIENESGIVATVGLFLSQYWYTDATYLDELWNHTHPDHRKSDYAKNLIDFSKWANENIGVVLMMGIMSTIRTEAKVRLYSRKLQMIGAFFANGIPDKNGFMDRKSVMSGVVK